MAIMQGQDNVFWAVLAGILTILTCVFFWYLVIMGRDRPEHKQKHGEDEGEVFGDITENRAPLPKFLIITYVGVGAWALSYAIWTGVNGIGY